MANAAARTSMSVTHNDTCRFYVWNSEVLRSGSQLCKKKDQANKQLPESRHHIERKPCIQIRYMQMPSMTPPKKNIQRKGSTSYPTSLTHLPTRAEVVKCCVQVGHAEAPRRHHKKSKAANRITLQGKRELCNTLCGTADSWSGRMGHPPPQERRESTIMGSP